MDAALNGHRFGSKEAMRHRVLRDARLFAWKTIHSPVFVEYQGTARDKNASEVRECWNQARANGWQLDFEREVIDELDKWLATVALRESA